tara:strand:- start:61 stop:1077 length:1017 start_codon:yes stop_codon:yes gene_type:complete
MDKPAMQVGDAGERPVRNGRMTRQSLMQMSGTHASRLFEITAPNLRMRDTAIVGRFNNVECHSGLSVHATDTQEAHDLSMQWRMPPSLTVALMLEGTLNVWLDHHAMLLGRPEAPVGQVWSLTRSTRMRRQSQKGMRVRKVIISVPPAWIQPLLRDRALPNPNLSRFVATHRATTSWTPSRHALSLAQQILNPPDAPMPMQKLTVESKAIEIVREALSSIIAPAASATASQQSVTAQSRALRIRRYLQDNLQRRPSLQIMAREFGMSIGSMQAAFKAAYRTTIAEFCRELRLQQARTAIEQDGISIGEAAYRAGYASPASFSTAFKRHFGFPPSTARE